MKKFKAHTYWHYLFYLIPAAYFAQTLGYGLRGDWFAVTMSSVLTAIVAYVAYRFAKNDFLWFMSAERKMRATVNDSGRVAITVTQPGTYYIYLKEESN